MPEARLTLLKPAQLLRVTLRAGTVASLALGQVLPTASAMVLAGQPMFRGQRGDSGATARRHAFEAPHDYCAIAPIGTAEAAAGWSITRLTVAADGSTTVARATGAWADRATLTYT